MSFLIGDALAAAPAGQASLASFAPLLVIGVLFYFLIIRPQSKRVKDHRQLVENLTKGDEVVTNGGILGRITRADQDYLTIEVADGVEVHVQRQAVSTVLEKGTIKGL
ncbi:MAG: preprotein translocase subunit YajC [Gammaproteobacteria bacterium]|nr:preprotein translocase subunit YajC [Gammaproteobacteria bacterium]